MANYWYEEREARWKVDRIGLKNLYILGYLDALYRVLCLRLRTARPNRIPCWQWPIVALIIRVRARKS